MRKHLDISAETIQRFWEKIALCAHGESCQKCCWEWQGNRKSHGYGKFQLPGFTTNQTAHRAMWMVEVLRHTYIPEEVSILHHCDNPPCVNPWHLYEGTQADNVADMMARKRHKKRNALTAKEAAKIREMYLTGRYTSKELGDLLSLKDSTISHILHQKTHKEVQDDLQLFIDQMLQIRNDKKLRTPVKNFVRKPREASTFTRNSTSKYLRGLAMHPRYQTFRQIAHKAIKENVSINEATRAMRAYMIEQALVDYEGNRTHAAVALGLQRATLNAEIKRLQELGLLEGEKVGA